MLLYCELCRNTGSGKTPTPIEDTCGRAHTLGTRILNLVALEMLGYRYPGTQYPGTKVDYFGNTRVGTLPGIPGVCTLLNIPLRFGCSLSIPGTWYNLIVHTCAIGNRLPGTPVAPWTVRHSL